nr:Gag-Pol polyprotein [Tanacetum cinerariifolium]
VDNQNTEVIAPIAEVIPQVDDDSTEIQSPVILQDVRNDNLDIEVAHMGNDPLLSVPITEVASGQSSSTASPQTNVQPNDNLDIDVAHMGNDPLLSVPITEVASGQSSSTASPQTNVQPNHPMTYPNSKWTKDHPLNYIIEALTEACWIEAMQEELHEFKWLEVWELVPRPDKVMVITLKWIYKVKLDELGGILKNKARLVARGYRQEEGIDFEESFAPVA